MTALLSVRDLHVGFGRDPRANEVVKGVSFDLEAGSLYPALHRMTEAGLLKAEWRMSEAGRRARFYDLTPKGRRKLESGCRHCRLDHRWSRRCQTNRDHYFDLYLQRFERHHADFPAGLLRHGARRAIFQEVSGSASAL